MKATKLDLIKFLDENILIPAETHPLATEKIKRKARATRMRLNNLKTPEKVEEYFWSAMATDRGIDTYSKVKDIGGLTFEDVRAEFKKICGR